MVWPMSMDGKGYRRRSRRCGSKLGAILQWPPFSGMFEAVLYCLSSRTQDQDVSSAAPAQDSGDSASCQANHSAWARGNGKRSAEVCLLAVQFPFILPFFKETEDHQ